MIGGFDRGEFPRSLYLDGPSEPAKAAILADLRWSWAAKHPDSPPARVLRVAESGVDEILAAAQGGSLFAVPELTVVLEIEDLGKSEKKVAALADGLDRTSDAACLVLVSDDPLADDFRLRARRPRSTGGRGYEEQKKPNDET